MSYQEAMYTEKKYPGRKAGKKAKPKNAADWKKSCAQKECPKKKSSPY